MTHLITSLTMALAISLGGRDVDQAGISYCLHLAFPLFLSLQRWESCTLLSLSLPPKLSAGDVFPIDSSHI